MINPDVINPPLGPVKNCDNCKHDGVAGHLTPCSDCGLTASRGGDGAVAYSEWEPVVMQKPGPKYKTGGLVPPITGHQGKAKPLTAPDILSAAEKHMRDRAATYDKPEGERSMAQTVAVFNTFHGTSLTEAQGWHFQQILKDVRLFTRAGYHADSAEDCVAYAGLKAEAKAKE